jgi:hypothetical protein
MADPVTDFVSQQNLFNLARGQPAPGGPVESAADASVGLDDYMPPVPGNVTHMPQFTQRKYFDYAIEPRPAQQNEAFTSSAKQLTDILKAKESSDNYQAVNPKSSASGAYQYTDSTWNGYGGYAKAALAPPHVQDQKFKEDINDRLANFGGDPYKAIAAHYLPALADDPSKWNKPFKVHGRVVKPVLSYLKYVTQGTPLEAGLDEYLAQRK